MGNSWIVVIEYNLHSISIFLNDVYDIYMQVEGKEKEEEAAEVVEVYVVSILVWALGIMQNPATLPLLQPVVLQLLIH